MRCRFYSTLYTVLPLQKSTAELFFIGTQSSGLKLAICSELDKFVPFAQPKRYLVLSSVPFCKDLPSPIFFTEAHLSALFFLKSIRVLACFNSNCHFLLHSPASEQLLTFITCYSSLLLPTPLHAIFYYVTSHHRLQ